MTDSTPILEQGMITAAADAIFELYRYTPNVDRGRGTAIRHATAALDAAAPALRAQGAAAERERLAACGLAAVIQPDGTPGATLTLPLAVDDLPAYSEVQIRAAVAAERARIRREVNPRTLRAIADGIERDDELHGTESAILIPGGNVTDWLRRAADLIGDDHD